MADRHLYRCPRCGRVTRAHPTRAGLMRCASCGRTFGAEACRLRPKTPPYEGIIEAGAAKRVKADWRAAAFRRYLRTGPERLALNLERSLGRSPIERMESERNERFGRFARALVRGARPACLR